MTRRNIRYLSSTHQGEESILNDTDHYPLILSSSMLEDIEKINKQSSSISLHQLDQASAVIRAG